MGLVYYVAKYEVWQQSGGPEEGGWWYDCGNPVWKYSIPVPTKWLATKLCRFLNRREDARREKENKYGYTSVLSHRDDFYDYDFSDTFVPQFFPQERPHYE